MTEKAVDIKKYSEIDLYQLIGTEATSNEGEVSSKFTLVAVK
jgi:hypothetical protein